MRKNILFIYICIFCSILILGHCTLKFPIVKVGQFRKDVLFGVVALLGAEHLRHVGQLYGAVWADVGREEAALPLTDLGQSSQQLIEPEADRGLPQSVELLVELSRLLGQFPRVSQHFLDVALYAGLLDPDDRGGAV